MTFHYTKSEILDRINRLPVGEFWVFVIKQGWAALFGGLMLGVVILTEYVHLPWFHRYDWLFIFAILIQGFMLLAKLEKWYELLTIIAFHLVGLGMELFKTSSSIHAWAYPGLAVIKLGNVPLFSGFMYAAVGSYIARAWRVLELEYSHYPKRRYTVVLAAAIYANFFTHHYIYDFRYVLFLAFIALYWRVMVSYRLNKRVHRMPMIMSAIFAACVIWFAENLGTFTKAWIYPSQAARWQPVGLEKLGSWLLLLVISFIMVDLLHYTRARLAHKQLAETQL